MSIPDLVHCPECKGDDHRVLDYGERVGFVVVTLHCNGCGCEFTVEEG